MSCNPGRYNIKFYRGTTLDILMTYTIDSVPVDLSGYTATMDVRPSPSSSTLITQLTTGNGGLILNQVTGQIEIFISSADTANLPLGEYQYDLNIISSSSFVTKLIMGSFVVLDPVTE